MFPVRFVSSRPESLGGGETLPCHCLQARRRAPSIVFLDELDALVPSRNVRAGTGDQIYASIVSTLLSLMDGVTARGQVVVIAATNRSVC